MPEKPSAKRSSAVVLIEDDEDFAAQIRDWLDDQSDFSVLHAPLLEQGLKLARETRTVAVLLDWNLPDGAGLELLQAVVEAAPHAAVVVLGSAEPHRERVDAIRVGAQDFLYKSSITPGCLVRAVVHAIERKRIEEERVQRNADLESTHDYNSELLTRVSHFLHTQFESLSTLASLLRDTRSSNLSDEQTEWIAALERGLDDARSISSQLLDLSSLETSRSQCTTRQMPLRAVLETVEAAYRAIAAAQGIELRIESDGATQELPVSDGSCVVQIVQQFVSNAVKFTESGHVTVRTRRVRAGSILSDGDVAANEAVEIVVEDTGCGFSDELLLRLADFFAKKSGAALIQNEKQWIGLSICRRLSELVGGEIRVGRSPSGGSSFQLLLSFPENDQPRAAAPDTTSHITVSFRMLTRGRRAMIIDSDMREVYQLTATLERIGMEVNAASTPHKGLEHPDIHRADVIFVDLSAEDELVPFLTHFEHDEGSERRPKIFGLSNADPTLALRAHPRLDGRIRKPAQLPEVVAALRRAL